MHLALVDRHDSTGHATRCRVAAVDLLLHARDELLGRSARTISGGHDRRTSTSAGCVFAFAWPTTATGIFVNGRSATSRADLVVTETLRTSNVTRPVGPVDRERARVLALA